jgi:hypothetical protein
LKTKIFYSTLKNAVGSYNAGVVTVNKKIVGLLAGSFAIFIHSLRLQRNAYDPNTKPSLVGFEVFEVFLECT